MKIEFPATTGANPIVEGDKVTINYPPENTDGTAGTPTTLTYTYTGGNWVQDEKDSLKLEPTNESGKWVVKLPEDKLADNTVVKAQTTDVSGKTSAESNTTKVVAPFDEKSAQPTITVKAVDVVSNGEAANNEPEKAIVTVTTTAPKGSLVKVYKEGELNTPIGEGVVGDNGQVVITITEKAKDPSSKAPENITSTDKLVATVQEVGTDGTTPVKAPSIPSTAVQVGTPAVGKHSNNDVENSGGHEGDNTPPTTAPTLTAEQTGNKRGAVTVALPSDAQVGDRVVLEFTPENSEEKVIVTLTKGSDNNWTSNNTNVVANPTGNSAEIPANQVKDNSPVKVKIVDLAGNETAGQDVTTAFDEVTLLRDVSLTKAIDTDTVSNATPEKFTITGKAEKDAVVKAYVMYNNEKVEIGSTTVASENGEFTFDTNNIRDGQLKEKLKDFNFSTNSPATAITLEATSTGKAPSAPQTVNATAARKGEKDDHTETTAPENPTITPYVEGFGGAKVVLPTPAQGEALEVEITLTPKGENGASEQAKKVKLAHNGSQWVVEGDNANLITLKQVDGKTVAIVTGDKAPFGGTLSATTTDFAGNKPEQAATQELNKGPTDQTAKDTHSPERTDVPTITAGRAEAVSGVDNDQPNAGDIVAKPGGDNDRMVVKYVDENGQAKEIFVKKDLEQGKWVLDTTQPAEQDKKPAESDYIIKDDGTVIVKGQKVKDGSEAEAVGYKTVGDQQKASSEPYVDNKDSSGNTLEENQIPTDENGQKRTRTDLAKIITHKDDETPTETDAPTVTKGQNGTLEQGSAKIKPGPDNTEVVVKFQGYAKTVTETTPTTSATGADGQAGATQQTTTKVITSTPVTGATTGDAAQTQTPQNENAVLIAKKENGEWKLYTTTETDYNTKVTGTDGKEHNAPKNLMPAPEDVATIDKTSGEITLKPQAVQDNTQVSATGFNAMKQPTTGKEGISQTVDAGLDAKGIKDKTVYSPEITQTNKGDVMVKPGQDNKEMTVTYTDKNGQTQTIKLEKVPASQGETGTAAYPQDATKWVVKKEGTTITGTDGTTTGDTVGTTTENGETISLPNGVTVDTTTGVVTIPKDATQIGKTVKADAKDDQNNTITTGDYTVQEDMTLDRADPITTGNDGDKATFTPGDDTKEMEFFKKPTNGTTSEDKPNGESIGKVVKKENGQWEWQGKGTNTGDAPQVDPATGKVTFPSGGGSLVGDGNGIVAVATDGKNNKSTPTEPVVPPKKDSSEHAAETPTVKPITEGEQQGGMEVTPGGDNNTLTVRYEKEVKPEEGATGTSDGTSDTEGEKNYETITAVKDPNTNKWSFSGDVPSEIAEIDEDTGKITLKPEAVKDGTGIKVEATDSSGNTIVKENDESTKAPSNPDVVDPNNQPKPPTVEPEPETPAQPPAQPEFIDDTTTITPADETPTTFKNTGIGQVQINPEAGVDFISFTVTTKDGGEQNIAFIKDDNGWEKYVMQLGDGNGNDIVDGDEKVIYDNVQTIGNGALTVSNITSDSITNILVGKAGDEFLQPQPTKPTAQIDSANRGGAIVKVGENTSKFKVTYYDEKTGKQKTLVYAKESNNWALKEVDGQQSSQAPEGVNLTNEGKVTLAPNTVKDNSTVKIESYNMEGFIKGNASVKTTLDVVNYDGVTTGFQNITGRLGYNSWTGIFGIKGNDDVYQDWGNSPSSGLKQLSEGGYGNSRPQSTRPDGDGATYKWSNRNDTVLIHETLGKQNEQSGKNYLLTLDFQQGNDTLVVGNDLGTKYKRDGKDIIRLNMGEGDDLLMVGTDNEYFEEYRNKKTGEIDIFTKDAKNSSQWSSQNMDQTWERLSNQINHRNQAGGGRIENATINMGRGDDTIIVEGITGENFGAIMGSTIDLGDGNNRVVIAPNGAYAYKPGHYFNSPMQARGNIKSSTILGGRDSDFIKAALIEQGANIQLKDGNDHVVVNRFQSSTLDMGAGDDLVEIRNYSKDPTTGQTLPGLGTILWDTQIGAGTKINLGTGNDTFFQGSKHIDYDVQINGGSGIDLYRVGGGSKATTDKIKGFERVELVDNGAIIGIKYSDLKASGLELPMKVMKGTEVKNGDKVKVDLGNNNSDWLADSPAQNLGDQGGSWRNGSTVKEDGRTYNVYTINSDVKHQVWVENGIIVI
ncbi:hypothetical protein KZ368_01360 [Glaesserella parasuis]|uniref:hypothetical protein n=1 Tax=Glaesserella parasuis TaxID=738 RepID=UPI0021BDD032|nr:hypothetical protein [Glaesserella parasuis]MCT8570975.1 hypothetical protein [Glaesserella parasuis]MCT8795594.1 hypothetical protein [Glaesserella parasuis]